jgi:hypothetical protein
MRVISSRQPQDERGQAHLPNLETIHLSPQMRVISFRSKMSGGKPTFLTFEVIQLGFKNLSLGS